jgi:hypothetical protein
MRAWFVVLIFSISAVAYLFGFRPVLINALQGGFSIENLLQTFATNSSFLFPIIFAIFGAGLGFIHTGIIRDALTIGAIIYFLNLFVLPTTFLDLSAVNSTVATLVTAFLNVLVLLFVLDFLG